jgi:hypothetical protein
MGADVTQTGRKPIGKDLDRDIHVGAAERLQREAHRGPVERQLER